jgi:hypothetical protein
VVLFRKRRGADRKLGTARTVWKYERGDWGLVGPRVKPVYAKVKRKSGDGYVCLFDRSPTLRKGESIAPPHGLE